MAKLKRIGSLLALYARMDLSWFLQDTFCCVMCIISDLLSNISAIAAIFLLSVRFEGIGGLTSDEVLFILGFFTLADGFTFMLTGGTNIGLISRRIGRGQLEHMLVQPTPLWMQVLTDGFLPVSGNAGLLCGILVTGVAIHRLNLSLSLTWFATLLLYLILRMVIVVSACYLLGSISFYRPASSEEISALANDLFTTLGKYPLAGLPEWLIGVLCTVLPVGLVGWLPASILLGQINQPALMALPLAVAALLLTLAIFGFQKGLRHYVKQGCNRYRAVGHRR